MPEVVRCPDYDLTQRAVERGGPVRRAVESGPDATFGPGESTGSFEGAATVAVDCHNIPTAVMAIVHAEVSQSPKVPANTRWFIPFRGTDPRL